jgi:hypothetical protein
MNRLSAYPTLFSLFLLLCVGPPAIRGQSKTQDSSSPNTTAPGKTSVPSDGRIFVVTLSKTVDVKKLKAGDIITAYAPFLGIPTSPSVSFQGRVLEVHALGGGNMDSLLLIRIEGLRVGNNQETPAHLKLQAVVAPLDFKWSISPIIVDRFPCDPDAAPKGCGEKADKRDDISGLGGGGRVCEKNPKKGTGQPGDNCVPVSEASGVYGFPDLSVTPYPSGSEKDFAITSIKKNVHLEQGTVLIFSDTEMGQKAQP